MTEEASFSPVYTDKVDQAAKNLKLALPLISKNKSPVNPVNYAIWYEYVAGDNKALSDTIDTLLAKDSIITTKMSQTIYDKYILMDMPKRLEKTNNSLQSVMNTTLANLNKVEASTTECITGLDESQEALNNAGDISEVKEILTTILSNTQQLSQNSSSLQSELKNSTTEIEHLKNELKSVKESARLDALSGLLNRGTFNFELENVCNGSQTDSALLLFDLDNFKNLNDTYGHLLGDNVIQFFAGILRKAAGDKHFAARYGGEEMAIILKNITQEEAIQIANSIRQKLAKSRLKRRGSDEAICQVTVSAGISMKQATDTPENMIERADIAMYKSKENGRNQVNIG